MKKQSLQLTELQSMYDEIQRRLEITLDKYYAQRHLQSLGAELEDMRSNMEAALRGKRAFEESLEECTARINEVTLLTVLTLLEFVLVSQDFSANLGNTEKCLRH